MLNCKMCLDGPGGVGKTALRERFAKNTFQAQYMHTIGADFCVKYLTVENRKTRVEIWDLAGQGRYHAVKQLYYVGAMSIIAIFDLSRPDSLHKLSNNIEDAWKYNEKKIIPIVLVGNKVDLRSQFPESISSETGLAYAHELSDITKEYGFEVPYIETSALTAENVNEVFHLSCKMIYKILRRLLRC